MALRVVPVDLEVEKAILTGLIASTEFAREILPELDFSYLQSDAIRMVAGWVLDYFRRYREAPGKKVEEIFLQEKQRMKSEKADLIGQLLQELSSRWVQEGSFNIQYYVDQALGYFRRRSLRLLSAEIGYYLDKGDLQRAEEAVRGFRRVAKDLSEWVNPFDPDFVVKALNVERYRLFKYPGVLGEVVGWFERGWLVGILAPMKRGKSFWLWETARQAVKNKLNVVVINLEMAQEKVAERMYRTITSLPRTTQVVRYPVFDCVRNQQGTCSRRERGDRIPLVFPPDGGLPKLEDNPGYRPCDECRKKGLDDYELAVWFRSVERPGLSVDRVVRKAQGFSTMYGDRLRLRTYPAYSASLEDIIGDLEALEYSEGFVPDVVVVDYADILNTRGAFSTTRDKLDDIWKGLKRLAQERSCLVVTASQSNRGSIRKRDLAGDDVAEDIRKLAHVDVLLGLNQTREEKRMGVLRVSLLANRDEEFHEDLQVAVLEARAVGQVYLGGHVVDRAVAGREPGGD